jgi:hypothetical protein
MKVPAKMKAGLKRWNKKVDQRNKRHPPPHRDSNLNGFPPLTAFKKINLRTQKTKNQMSQRYLKVFKTAPRELPLVPDPPQASTTEQGGDRETVRAPR